MLDPDAPGIAGYTSAKAVMACKAAALLLLPVAEIVAPLAKSRPDAPASDDLVALARNALRKIEPITTVATLTTLVVAPLSPPQRHQRISPVPFNRCRNHQDRECC